MLLVDVDDHFLDRFEQAAVVGRSHHDTGTRDGQFKAFAAHGLDQHGKLQFAAAGDVEGILVVRFLDAQCDVALGLPLNRRSRMTRLVTFGSLPYRRAVNR